MTLQGEVREVRYSPKGNYLLIETSQNDTLLKKYYIWMFNTRKLVPIPLCNQVALCPSGTRIACYAYNWNAFQVIDIATGKVIQTLPLKERIYSFQFSPDEQWLIYAQTLTTGYASAEYGLWGYHIETRRRRLLKNWLEQLRRQGALNVDTIVISGRPLHKKVTVFVGGTTVDPSGLTHQSMSVTYRRCTIDIEKDQLIGNVVGVFNMDDKAYFKDGSMVYDSSYWDEKAKRDVMRLTWTNFKQKKHVFTFYSSLFSGADEEMGYVCARNAMKMAVYGILVPRKQPDRQRWTDSLAFLWTVNPQARTKSLVLRERVRLIRMEKWVIPSSVDLSPDGRQLAYISYRDSHNVIFKNIT